MPSGHPKLFKAGWFHPRHKKLLTYTLSGMRSHSSCPFWLLTCFLRILDLHIRFQEIVDLNAGSLLIDHNDNEPWEEYIAHALSTGWPGTKYVQVCCVIRPNQLTVGGLFINPDPGLWHRLSRL